MRYPDGHKEQVRAQIVRTAARALKEHGLEGISIPALMKKAGLTHGGFYVHFKDRDDLVAAAVQHAAEETGERVFGPEVKDLEATLQRYLSMAHVEHPAEGCVVAALGPDGARQGKKVRRSFARAAEGLIRLVGQKLDPRQKAEAPPTEQALALTAQMVGAVILARLVDDPALAKRILAAVHPQS
jgi:TetR/AcrR family transcriptional repressor of nem operon